MAKSKMYEAIFEGGFVRGHPMAHLVDNFNVALGVQGDLRREPDATQVHFKDPDIRNCVRTDSKRALQHFCIFAQVIGYRVERVISPTGRNLDIKPFTLGT